MVNYVRENVMISSNKIEALNKKIERFNSLWENINIPLEDITIPENDIKEFLLTELKLNFTDEELKLWPSNKYSNKLSKFLSEITNFLKNIKRPLSPIDLKKLTDFYQEKKLYLLNKENNNLYQLLSDIYSNISDINDLHDIKISTILTFKKNIDELTSISQGNEQFKKIDHLKLNKIYTDFTENYLKYLENTEKNLNEYFESFNLNAKAIRRDNVLKLELDPNFSDNKVLEQLQNLSVTKRYDDKKIILNFDCMNELNKINDIVHAAKMENIKIGFIDDGFKKDALEKKDLGYFDEKTTKNNLKLYREEIKLIASGKQCNYSNIENIERTINGALNVYHKKFNKLDFEMTRFYTKRKNDLNGVKTLKSYNSAYNIIKIIEDNPKLLHANNFKEILTKNTPQEKANLLIKVTQEIVKTNKNKRGANGKNHYIKKLVDDIVEFALYTLGTGGLGLGVAITNLVYRRKYGVGLFSSKKKIAEKLLSSHAETNKKSLGLEEDEPPKIK